MLNENVYRKRMDELRDFLREKGADFALLTPSPSFQYLTGLDVEMSERLIALLLPSDGDPVIVSPAFEVSHLSGHTWLNEFMPWEEDEDPYSMIADHVGSKDDGHKVALDNSLPLGVYWAIEKVTGQFKSTTSMTTKLDQMRLLKSEAEIELMKKAGKIIAEAVLKGYQEATVGITELEINQIVQNEILRQGAQPTFAAIQFGENSALPHVGPSNRDLRRCDIVLMDCGCTLSGYNTDMTRVGVVGEPSDDQQEVYEIVLRSQEAAIEQLAPGLSCGKADGIARLVIEESGHAEHFTHRLGHGIGLEVHEPPYLVRGNPQELVPGMSHSVEPGIYMEGLFGIRIEDLVVIREDGCETITYMPKDLYIIEP